MGFINSTILLPGTHRKPHMGWLRLVGSLKLQVSFAEYRLFHRALLQKRRMILWSVLIVATPQAESGLETDSRIWAVVSAIGTIRKSHRQNSGSLICFQKQSQDLLPSYLQSAVNVRKQIEKEKASARPTLSTRVHQRSNASLLVQIPSALQSLVQVSSALVYIQYPRVSSAPSALESLVHLSTGLQCRSLVHLSTGLQCTCLHLVNLSTSQVPLRQHQRLQCTCLHLVPQSLQCTQCPRVSSALVYIQPQCRIK